MIFLVAAVKMRGATVLMGDPIAGLTLVVRVKEGSRQLGSAQQKQHADENSKGARRTHYLLIAYIG